MAVYGTLNTMAKNDILRKHLQVAIDASVQIDIYSALGYSVMYSADETRGELHVHAIHWDLKTRFLTMASYNNKHGTNHSADEIEAAMFAVGGGTATEEQQEIYAYMTAAGREVRDNYNIELRNVLYLLISEMAFLSPPWLQYTTVSTIC